MGMFGLGAAAAGAPAAAAAPSALSTLGTAASGLGSLAGGVSQLTQQGPQAPANFGAPNSLAPQAPAPFFAPQVSLSAPQSGSSDLQLLQQLSQLGRGGLR